MRERERVLLAMRRTHAHVGSEPSTARRNARWAQAPRRAGGYCARDFERTKNSQSPWLVRPRLIESLRDAAPAVQWSGRFRARFGW